MQNPKTEQLDEVPYQEAKPNNKSFRKEVYWVDQIMNSIS